MLDIAIIMPKLSHYGGAQRFLIECVTRWQQGHQLTLYSTEFNGSILREHGVDLKKVSLIHLTPCYEGAHSMFLNGILLPKIWEQEIGKHQVYHAHQWPTHLIDRHPMVWYPHEPWRHLHDMRYNRHMDETLARGIAGKLPLYTRAHCETIADLTHEAALTVINQVDQLGNPDRVVANSRYMAGYLEAVYGRPVPDVVYPGVNVDDFIPIPSEEDLVVTIGSLGGHKRQRLILEAVKQVRDIELHVVGSGSDKNALEKMAEQLGIAGRVSFLQGLTNQEIHILLSRALAVLYTPIKEPFGIVALEAMAAARPLIAVAEGGYTEVVDKSCALLVPPKPTALANKIRHLRNNRALARQMGLAGLEKARNYSWDRTAAELLAILEGTSQAGRQLCFGSPALPETPRPLFGVQYYCWYNEGKGGARWSDLPDVSGTTDMPALGYYASHHGTVIEDHLRQLESVGMNFAVLNLHLDDGEANGNELAACEHIFCVAQRIRSPLQFAIQVCPLTAERDNVMHLVNLIRKVFVRRQSYLKLQGKPVLFVKWTGMLDGARGWFHVFDEPSQEFVRIACSARPYLPDEEHLKTFGLFNGWTLEPPFFPGDSAGWEKLWQQAYDDSAPGPSDLRVVTLSPGYDGRRLSVGGKELRRVVERGEGKTYQRMLDFALSLETAPHLVVVSSFNNYHNNSYVEESQLHGTLYLDMTRQFIQTARARWRGAGRDASRAAA